MLRNRRIGCSVSGVTQFISKHGLHALKEWLTRGYASIAAYDEKYALDLGSARTFICHALGPIVTPIPVPGAGFNLRNV